MKAYLFAALATWGALAAVDHAFGPAHSWWAVAVRYIVGAYVFLCVLGSVKP